MTTNLVVYLTLLVWVTISSWSSDKIPVDKGCEIGLILVDPVVEKLKASGTALFD